MNRDRVFIAPTGPDAGRREEIRERARARGFRGFVLTEDDRFEPRPSERYLRWEENRLVPLGEGAGAHEASITDVSTPLELDRVIEEARPARGRRDPMDRVIASSLSRTWSRVAMASSRSGW